ncbi:MAG TPA: WbqC family protein [Candidatus Omnitrophota bacterium]|nr:WbqC family protein [Candidatus Omnitrophota bacterium]
MVISVHQPQYIPWLGYFEKMARSDMFVFLDNVQYKVREFQNRNRIRTEKGWMWLTVPVVTKDGCRMRMNEVLIDNTMPWQRKHLGSIKASYGSAPYFDDYFPFFEEILSKKWDKLSDLNVCIIRFVMDKLSIATPIVFESDLGILTTKTQRIIDICLKLNADTYLSGVGAKDYLDESLFPQNKIKLFYQHFDHPEYRQCFEPFMPYMSVIDLLFNHGPASRGILIK